MRRSPEAARIKASRSSPVTWGCGYLGVMGLVFVLAGPIVLAAFGVAMVVGAGWLLTRFLRTSGAWLDVEGVEIRGVFVRARIEWPQLRSIRTKFVRRQNATGDQVSYLDPMGRSVGSTWWDVLLEEGCALRFTNFLMGHGIPVLVNPPDDPRVRLDTWRTPVFDHDPFESIVTVRRAVIGDRVVSVRPRGVVFIAVTTDERTGEQIAISDDQPDLAHAVQQAYEQIRTELARRRS